MSTGSKLAMASLVSAAAATTGCYSTWDLTPQAIVKLDGYRVGQEVHLETADHEKITYRHDSSLRFQGNHGAEAQAQFQSIEIDGPILTGVEKEKGTRYIIDLRQINSVQAQTFSPGKTAVAVTAGVALGAPVVAFGGLMVAIMASGGIGGGRPLRAAGEDDPIAARLLLDLHNTRRRSRILSRHVDANIRARIFAHWAREASAECASVPAFLAIARDLKRASAPENLIRAALQAAREEANHTALCTDIANMHADEAIITQAPDVPRATDESLEALLERMALESFWDGCVAEGAAAVGARRSALSARDAETRLALGTIARDEHEHARLSRDILAFCLSAGGTSIRRALRASFEAKRAEEEALLSAPDEAREGDGNIDDDFLAHCGVPNENSKREARIEAWERSLNVIALA